MYRELFFVCRLMEARRAQVHRETTSVAGWELPVELVDDILSRLPAKTLCRFKCVCKAWHYTLSDLSFKQLHYARSIQKPPLLVVCDCNSIVYDHTTPLCTFNMDAQLLHRFNAIIPGDFVDILMHPSCFSLFCLQTKTTYIICNPSTHEVVPLPRPLLLDTNASFEGGFGCYPASWDQQHHHRHVVVHVLTDQTGAVMGCEELTFGIGDDLSKCSWRMLNAPPPHAPTFINPLIGGGTFVDGVFYWMIDPRKHQEANQHELILSLDLKEERFTTIPPPPDLDFNKVDSYYLRLTEVKGQLYLFCPFPDSRSRSVQMWALVNNTDNKVAKWSKEYSIPIPDGVTYFYPLHTLNHGDLLVSTKSTNDPESEFIHIYNKQTNTLNNLLDLNTFLNNPKTSSYWGIRLHTDNIFSLRSNSNASPRLQMLEYSS